MRLRNETLLTNNQKLCAWWANNRGRGGNNCTLAVVTGDAPRAACFRLQTNVATWTRVSSWAGNVNFSRRVAALLGLDYDEVTKTGKS